jgi:KDO2-lipid IV(A) lauroyltransferase
MQLCYFTPLGKKTAICVKYQLNIILMLVTFFRFFSWLPLPVLHAIGVVLGWLTYFASASYRHRLKDNISRAGYRQYLHAAIAESGKNIAELPFIWYGAPRRVLKKVTFENWDLVQKAFDAKRGILFLTPHLGCFEVTAQAMATHTPLTVMYRPPRKAALKPLVEGARIRPNLSLAPANLTGVRILLKTLKKNGVIGILPDQVPQEGEGVWANFFGKPAYTMTLPAKMHQMTDAPIILTYAERLPFGKGYVMRFVPFDQPLGETLEQQTAAINAAMERLISSCPAQYFWSYNRYKTPPGVSAPDFHSEGHA